MRPDGRVRFRSVVIHEKSLVTALTKGGASEFPDIRTGFQNRKLSHRR